MAGEHDINERQIELATRAPVYEIRVRGQLEGEHWRHWFEGMTMVIDEENSETVLYGPVYDQSALYGLLARIRDMALPLLSVQVVEEGPPPGEGRRGRGRGRGGVNWLLLVAYLLILGGLSALTIFLTAESRMETSLALSLLGAALTGVGIVFFRYDQGRGWLVLSAITGLGTAITLFLFVMIVGWVPVSLAMAVLLLMAGGGLVYALLGWRAPGRTVRSTGKEIDIRADGEPRLTDGPRHDDGEPRAPLG